MDAADRLRACVIRGSPVDALKARAPQAKRDAKALVGAIGATNLDTVVGKVTVERSEPGRHSPAKKTSQKTPLVGWAMAR